MKISIGETTNFIIIRLKQYYYYLQNKFEPEKKFFWSNETHTLFKTRSFVTAEFHLSLAQKLVGALIPLKNWKEEIFYTFSVS